MPTTWNASYTNEKGEVERTQIMGIDQQNFFYGRQNVGECDYPISDTNLSGRYYPSLMKRRIEDIDELLELRRVIIHRLKKRHRLPLAKIIYLFTLLQELCKPAFDDKTDWEELGRKLKKREIDFYQFKNKLCDALGGWWSTLGGEMWFHDAWRFDVLTAERNFLRDVLTFLGDASPAFVQLESSNFPDL